MLKTFLALIVVLFHLQIHAQTMLVNPLEPASIPAFIEEFSKHTLQVVQESPHKINEINEDGYTLLQQALINQALMEQKVADEMNSTNGSENNILDSNMMNIKLLLDNGADPNIPFPTTRIAPSAYTMVREWGNKEHFLLKAARDYRFSQRLIRSRTGSPRLRVLQVPLNFLFPLHIIELLFDYDLSADITSPNGNTALMEAIATFHSWERSKREYRSQLIQLILKHTNNIDAQNENGDTALHLASHLGDLQTIRLLIQKGANLSIRNVAGYTPEEKAKSMDSLSVFRKPQYKWYWHFSFLDRTSYKVIRLLQEAKEKQQ